MRIDTRDMNGELRMRQRGWGPLVRLRLDMAKRTESHSPPRTFFIPASRLLFSNIPHVFFSYIFYLP